MQGRRQVWHNISTDSPLWQNGTKQPGPTRKSVFSGKRGAIFELVTDTQAQVQISLVFIEVELLCLLKHLYIPKEEKSVCVCVTKM